MYVHTQLAIIRVSMSLKKEARQVNSTLKGRIANRHKRCRRQGRDPGWLDAVAFVLPLRRRASTSPILS